MGTYLGFYSMFVVLVAGSVDAILEGEGGGWQHGSWAQSHSLSG